MHNLSIAYLVVDLGFNGYRFIWRNGRGGVAFVEERLDRAVATSEWREMFPRTKVRHIPTSYSDHDPILMNMDPPTQPKKRRHKIQRFEEKWVTHMECETIIRDSWNQTQPQSSPMYCLFEKIKRCNMNLIAWSRVTFGNARNRLDARHGELMESGYWPNMERILEVKKGINEFLHHEEVFWRQRLHSLWLLVGDKNMKFFHQRASQRRRKNNIEGVDDRFGEWQTEEDQIAKIAEQYYKQLYTSTNSMDVEEVMEAMDQKETKEMAQSLTQASSKEEVKTALFQMHPSKAPGPDGTSTCFFQKFWYIVGHDVTAAILPVSHSRRYLRKMSYAHIVLIPKKKSTKIYYGVSPYSVV